MLSKIVLLGSLFVFWRLIKRDIAEREGVSNAIWIPTLWVGILLSRPLSMWLNWGGGSGDSLEGSPLDRLFYFGVILASVVILSRRGIVWSEVFSNNWPIFLFYGYFLVSVLWAPTPFVSFKRWFKDFGNIFVALVILTEVNPQQAIRAVFVRCAYLLIPLSVVFLRYFPELGRRYLRGGVMEVVGVTTQKNSLGALIVVCGFVLLWDWLERTKVEAPLRSKAERVLPLIFLSMGAYLLNLCDSKTSILCLILGAAILFAPRLPFLRERVGAMGLVIIIGTAGFFLLDYIFNIKGILLGMLGRDATFTGRTDVWRELLALKTDPVFGTGFCSFWSDQRYLSKLPEWVGLSAHNGYLETFIDGGFVALFFLGIMLLVTGLRLNRHLSFGGNYALFRFAVFIAIIIGSISESHFGRMGPVWFVFLLTSIGFVHGMAVQEGDVKADRSPEFVFSGPEIIRNQN